MYTQYYLYVGVFDLNEKTLFIFQGSVPKKTKLLQRPFVCQDRLKNARKCKYEINIKHLVLQFLGVQKKINF